MPLVRQTVRFTGRVQGVGFRYTTCRTAERFNVTGWVRNDPDGAVTCVVEGDGAEVQRFIEAVQSTMRNHIADTTASSAQPTGEFDGFTVRY